MIRLPSYSRAAFLALLLALLLAPVSLAGAQASGRGPAKPAPKPAGPLPDARAVLKRFADSTGAAKLAAMPGVHMIGTFEVPSQGLNGIMESFTDKAGRSLQVISITSIGAMEQGSDSTIAWALDPVQGPRILQGKELAQRRDEEDPRGMSRDPSFVVSAQTLARTAENGQPCVQLLLKWKSGRESTECYSEKTGLLVSMESVQFSTIGDVPFTRYYTDYQTFDGVTLATKVVEHIEGIDDVQHITDVIFEAIDPKNVAIPPQIQALRKK